MTQMNILSRAGGECVIQYKDIANFTIKDAKGKKVKTIRESKNRIRFATQKRKYLLLKPLIKDMRLKKQIAILALGAGFAACTPPTGNQPH